MALGVLVVYGVIQALEAYIILPLIMRGAVNMHPAITLFTVVLWGKIFGVPGLILAIPLLAGRDSDERDVAGRGVRAVSHRRAHHQVELPELGEEDQERDGDEPVGLAFAHPLDRPALSGSRPCRCRPLQGSR